MVIRYTTLGSACSHWLVVYLCSRPPLRLSIRFLTTLASTCALLGSLFFAPRLWPCHDTRVHTFSHLRLPRCSPPASSWRYALYGIPRTLCFLVWLWLLALLVLLVFHLLPWAFSYFFSCPSLRPLCAERLLHLLRPPPLYFFFCCFHRVGRSVGRAGLFLVGPGSHCGPPTHFFCIPLHVSFLLFLLPSFLVLTTSCVAISCLA